MKNPKNILEWVVALVALVGFFFNLFSGQTVFVTLLCTIGLVVIYYKKIWTIDADETVETSKNRDFIKIMKRTKKILALLLIFLPVLFMLLNISSNKIPPYANKFVAYHFSSPNKFIEIQTEKKQVSEFELYSSSDTINQICFGNIETGNPKVAIKRLQNEYYLMSLSFIMDESFNFLSNEAFTFFKWFFGLMIVLIISMLIIDKINLFFKT
ncbi:MAG: hypothetical protein PF694_06150 [Bacteroidetes bacterium]|jgi:hypothetical protein|nr:hypothetical protein [Bacteroidota bacterium]